MSRDQRAVVPRPNDGPPIPAVHSLLSPDALGAELPRRYAVGSVQQCVLLRSLTNDVYVVTTAAARYVLKVYGHGWRSLQEVAWEAELLAHLAAKGCAVPQAIPAADGQLVGAIRAPEGQRAVVLFPYADGEKPDGPSVPLYRGVGQALAHLHRASADFRSQHPRRPLDPLGALDQTLDVLSARLAGRPKDQPFLRQLAYRAHERLTALAARGLEWGVCHGDVSLDNVHIDRDGRIIFYDFDSAGPGWRASDPYGVMTWLTGGKPEYWDAFLAGYEAVRPLAEADRQALPWFVPVQMLDNLRWHLTDWLRYRGTLSLAAGYVDNALAALRRWDRDALGNVDTQY